MISAVAGLSREIVQRRRQSRFAARLHLVERVANQLKMRRRAGSRNLAAHGRRRIT